MGQRLYYPSMAFDDEPTSKQRILMIRPTALGDVVRTVPVLVTLRLAFPNATIDWLVNDTYADGVAHHPALDEVVCLPRQRFGKIFQDRRVAAEAWTWARRLRDRKYEMVFDLQGLSRSALMTWITRAPQRIGFANAREMAWLAYNRRHHIDMGLHTVDRMLGLVAAGGHRPQIDLRLYPPPQAVEWTETFLSHHGLKDEAYATIAPTARWRCKCWPLDRYLEVARRLLDSKVAGERILILVSPDERRYAQPLADTLGKHALFPTTTVGQMMGLISRTRLLISNDSAPLHVAVGFARPLTAIFGPTDPALVGPYGQAESVIRPPMAPGSPPVHYRRHRNDQSLIAQVTVDTVWERILAQLSQGSKVAAT